MNRVLIIGATSGIGRELALRMTAEGCTVGTTGRRDGIPGIMHTAFDITAHGVVERLERFAEEMGGVDTVVFCAGTGDLSPVLDVATEVRTNAVNVDAFTRVMAWAWGYFAARGGGHIAAVTSVMGLRGAGAAPAYGASKAYQINFLEALRQRSARENAGIRVTDLRPGSVDTAMMKGEGHFWISTPQRAAGHIVDALRRGRSVAYISPRWRLIGAAMKIVPGGLWQKM